MVYIFGIYQGNLSASKILRPLLPRGNQNLTAEADTFRNEVIMSKVNIAEKFSKITEYWKPYIGAELNGQHVKFDKLKASSSFTITKMRTKCFWS